MLHFHGHRLLLILLYLSLHREVHTTTDRSFTSQQSESILSNNVDSNIGSKDNDYYDLRWVSSTGGWRSLAINVGLTHVLAQKLNLISTTHCNMTSISGASGASWFATQLLFSQPFFNEVVGNNITAKSIQLFVQEWITSMVQYHESIHAKQSKFSVCNILDKLLPTNGLPFTIISFTKCCKVLQYANGDWAQHLYNIFQKATTDYGDPTFVTRQLSYDNLLSPFKKNTELYVHMALSTTSRIRQQFFHPDIISYISPTNTHATKYKNTIYTVPIGIIYVVNKTSTNLPQYQFLTESDSLPLRTIPITQSKRNRFSLKQYENMFLYNNRSKASVYIEKSSSSIMTSYPLRPFFNGIIPTTAQVNAATSSAFSILSGATPSIFAQAISYAKHVYGIDVTAIHSALTQLLYNLQSFKDSSVCTQWPKKCTTSDSRLIDGDHTEGGGITTSIGQYQLSKRSTNATQNKLKIIHTNCMASPNVIDRYFDNRQDNSTTNQKPGDYYWPNDFFIPVISYI